MAEPVSYEIRGGGYRAVVLSAGAALAALEREGTGTPRALTETWDVTARPPLGAGSILAPWPNRIRDGRFDFDGVPHRLAITEPALGNASHGFVRRLPWRVTDRAPDRVTLAVDIGLHEGWPYPLHTTVTYRLAADGLTVTHTAVNTGVVPAPFGLGVHPYLRAGDFPVDECSLTLAAGTRLPLDDRMIPAAPSQPVAGSRFDFTSPRPLRGVVLDTPFSALLPDGDGRARHRLSSPDGIATELWTSPAFRWLQVFTAGDEVGKPFPGRGRALAVEPMTCPPDAFNSGVDVVVLAPDRSWEGSWGLAAVWE
ncbi:aldose 1-epimerase family protein [Rhodococcus triatomae]|uniref:Aldose 1-epimerase n=1 Tax=Rhodococcus triatomae TaxID=300028 RepID=A0A1G8ARK6_9NOCA|nr:aldose 1-epimerase family protein [Rhodococcus triatomae]QNG17695.1 aldose 1-epimerase family protein [Rhodococcus triatomae]QNG22638.1 aldose 1-epimerase family protein [Rhodococcus triatomae]SDH23366.1 aldose 1-epimerase [Rhodococcus triatomae]